MALRILLLLLSSALLAAACHPELDLSGFPCGQDSDCLSLRCNQGVCGSGTQPKADAPATDGGPLDVPAADREPPPPPLEGLCYVDPTRDRKKGACRQGIKHPTTGACEGAIGHARNELCGDGIDNDCDGDIDEGCCDLPPQKEVCDGKDNDCNSRIDDSFPDKGLACTAPCGKEGRWRCFQGQKFCYVGATEICGNGIDDDCDGKVNQEPACGVAYNYASVYKRSGFQPGLESTIDDGTKAQRSFKLPVGFPSRTNPEYMLLAPSKDQHCTTDIILLAPKKSDRMFSSYICSGGSFKIFLRSRTRELLLYDDGFQVVQPKPKALDSSLNRIWARVDVAPCSQGQAACEYKATSSSKMPKISRSGKGRYGFPHALCHDPTQPGFVTIFSDKADAFGRFASDGAGTCYIHIYDKAGNPTDNRSFAFWLPDPKKSTWATFSVEGELLKSNPPPHPLYSWSLHRGIPAATGVFRYTLTHPTMSGSTAAFLNPLGPTITSIRVPHRDSKRQLYMWSFDPKAPSNRSRAMSFSVLLVH